MTTKPTIEALENGPLLIKGLKTLRTSKGEVVTLEKDVVALCRCGASKNKPFCDGAHTTAGFSSQKERTETYPVREYAGQELTVVDDIGICCHAGECVKGAADVFFRWEGEERISVPDAADASKVEAVVRQCPSGSLLVKKNGQVVDKFFEGKEPEIAISENGPLNIRGETTLSDPSGAKPPTEDHYTLCRCGASANKPFCDGAHKKVNFVAE